MNYKVGDKVRVRSDIAEHSYDICVRLEMREMAGTIHTVKYIWGTSPNRIEFEDSRWVWTEDMIEPVDSDESHDPVSNPSHYTSGGIECIDAMIAAYGKETVSHFCICNAFKYLWRHLQKGNAKQDCEKAQWYINKYLELMEDER